MNDPFNSKVFISYSHKNPDWKDRLLRHLDVFAKHHLLDVWHDETIDAGDDWRRRIEEAMATAKLAVVLLCPDALKSTFILTEEFPALERRWNGNEITVVPILCKKDCPWSGHEWLAKLQIKPCKVTGPTPLEELTDEADVQLRHLAAEIAGHVGRIALSVLPKPAQPLAPDHIYLDQFPLTNGPSLREEKLIGREQELALLDLAFAQPHTAIASLVAWGGVGKTMLVQNWLRRLQREGWYGVERVYAWSFYSQGTTEDRQASEDLFLAHALECFGVECEPTLSPWEKGRLLADAVACERTLLILDGIEPLQYPPGPMGGQLRAPGVQSLLKQLARKANSAEHHGLCLVTTREPLTDLNDFQRREGAPWGSVLRVNLGNLTEDAGAALLHHAGANRAGAAEINPDDKELLAASREVDGHALTLNLLGRFLARAHSGDIRRRDLVKFEEADRKEQGGTTFKMLAAFENWFDKGGEFGARQLAILRMLGLFDRPADAGCIAALRSPPAIAGLTEPLFTMRIGVSTGQATLQPLADEDWNTAVSFLADFGLVGLEAEDNHERVLECHPLIREHFAKEMHSKAHASWCSSHQRLYEHLKQNSVFQPKTIEETQPLYQAVTHGCHAGLYQKAADLFWDRILRGDVAFTIKCLGNYSAEIGVIASFFNKPWSNPVETLSSDVRAWILNNAAYCLRAVGRLGEAVEPMRTSLKDYVQQAAWRRAAMVACNISELQLSLGDTKAALHDSELGLGFARRSDDSAEIRDELSALADAFAQTGQKTEAMLRFREAEQIQNEFQPDFPYLYGLCGFQYCDLLLSQSESTAWRLTDGILLSRLSDIEIDNQILHSILECWREIDRRVLVTQKTPKELGLILDIALGDLTMGRSGIHWAILGLKMQPETPFAQNLVPIRTIIGRAIDGFRTANQNHFLPFGLLSRAWIRVLDGDIGGAQADLDEAWDIAERGPMRLHMADIHLYRARLFFHEKHYPWKSPQADLAAAEKLINDCGYHRRDEELADAKLAILCE